MPTLQRFERVILAWVLIGVIGAGPISANKLTPKRPRPVDSVNFVTVPQGTQTVTVTWTITPAVLPDREWNCGNGHGGFIDLFTYTPDQWVLNVYDLASNSTVAHQEGTSVPLLYSCPGGSAPTPTPETGSMQVDVSLLTADADATFLTAMGTTGEERTVTPGGSSPPFSCELFTQAVTVNAGISFPLRSITFDSACSASANAGRRTAQASRSGVVKLDDPVSCDIHDPQKLLTYIAPSDTKADGTPNYPSPFQRWKNDPNDHFIGVPLGDKPQMFIRGKANGVQSGKKIWLKLTDPPDLSPYVAQVSPSTGNDNKDDSAKLYGADGHHAKTGKVLPVVVDSDSRFEVVLEGAKNDAGDNYKVMASLTKPDDNDVFACEATSTCTLTPEITVWKRQYFEQAQMVTQGAFLAENIVGSTDACSTSSPCLIHLHSVKVDGVQVIQPGTQLTLMSMGPAAMSVPGAPFHEDVTVDMDSTTDGPSVIPDTDGTWIVRLTSRPAKNYYGARTSIRASLDAVAVRDAAGAINAFSVNSGAAKKVLGDAFIEYADAAPVSFPYIPYVGVANRIDEIYLGKRWFQHAAPGVDPVAEPYHRLIVAAKRAKVEPNCSTELGATFRHSNNAWRLSYVYAFSVQGGAAGALGTFYPALADQGDARLPHACTAATLTGLFGRDPVVMEQLDVAHEVVHQFKVNFAAHSADGNGHCGEKEYTGQYICLMNKSWPVTAVAAQINLGAARMHYLPGGVDSEYTEMRKLKEPIQ